MTTPATQPVWTCRRGAAALGLRAVATERPDLRPGRRDADTAALLDRLSPARYADVLSRLTEQSTRDSLSAGYTAAADFVADRLAGLGYTVSAMPIRVRDGLCDNVIADYPGTDARRGVVVVTAHLDSVNHADGPQAPAPGADDNASGSAGAVELAAVLATRRWPHDLRVILFGGEEQGLLGSTAYVAALPAAQRNRIRAVVNMDMIGRRNGATRGVLLEGAPASAHLIDALAEAAATWTDLTVSTSLHPFASDHVPFLDAGIPAVLTIEADDTANHDVHTARDTLGTLDPGLAEEILRMNIAMTASALRSRTPA